MTPDKTAEIIDKIKAEIKANVDKEKEDRAWAAGLRYSLSIIDAVIADLKTDK